MTNDIAPLTTVVISRTADNGSVSMAGTIAKTPGQAPDLYIEVVSPLVNIAIRGARTFLQSVLGLLSVGAVTKTMLPARDFLDLLRLACSLSLAAAVVSVIQNTIELLAKWDQTQPKFRG